MNLFILRAVLDDNYTSRKVCHFIHILYKSDPHPSLAIDDPEELTKLQIKE